jgi:hypothetical protein
MAAENIGEIGAELRAEYGGWLGGLLEGWIDPEAADTADVLAELARLEDAVTTLAADQAELGRLQTWLTAGFHADAPPIALPLAPAAADADDARDGSEAARLLGTASPPASRTRPTGGFATEPSGWNIPGAPTRSPERFDAIEDARTSGLDRPARAGSGDGDRDLPGSGDQDRGGSGDQDRGGSGDRHRGGSGDRDRFDVTADGGSVDRDRWGDGSAAPSEARHGAFDDDPHRPVQAKGAGGIGGLGDLAALAGLGGLDLPFTADEPRTEDEAAADQPRRPASPELPTPARARTWSAPDAPPATDRDPSPAVTPAQPIRLRGWPEATSVDRSGSSAERSGSAEWAGGSAYPGSASRGSAEESAEAAMRAVEDAERAARSWEALAAMAGGAEIAIPFERMPGEDDQAADLAPVPLPRPASPSPPVVSRGWGDADAMSGAFMADADERTVAAVAGMAGPRLRPAAEILGALGSPRTADPIAPGAPRTIIAPPPIARRDAEWPAIADVAESIATPDAATHPAEVPTVLVRGTVAPAADELTEPPSWPEADVTDVLDALSREIMHEYRRYYGE